MQPEIIETFNSNPESLTGEHSGSGMFSDVSLTPCETYAIKHGNHGFADGWLLYAAKLLTIPAEYRPYWAPMIHSLRIDLDNGTFVALMDAYEDYDYGPCEGGRVNRMVSLLDNGHYCEDAYCECEHCEFLSEVNEFGTDDCLRLLAEIESESRVPLHFDIGGNSMLDAKTGNVIFNDPVCVVCWVEAKESQKYREKITNYVRECAINAPDLFIKGESKCQS